MTRARRVVAATAILTALLIVPTALAVGTDKIMRKDGKPEIEDVTVSQDHFDHVKYKHKGGTAPKTLDGRAVEAIAYGDVPASYEEALQKRTAAQFENAISLFRSAMAESGVGDWIKLHGAYQIAQTYALWGEKDRTRFAAAVKAYDEALAIDARARIRPNLLLGRSRAHLGAGEVDAAIADLDTLADEANTNKYGVEWELNALYEKAKTLENAGKAAEAKREYSRLQIQARSFSDMSSLNPGERDRATKLAGLARLAPGRALIRDEKQEQAERFFDDIARDAGELGEIRAQALVGKALALRAQKKLKAAQVALATVRVNHYWSDARAEATYFLGVVAEELGAAEPRRSQLAQGYFLEVVDRHSGSEWARKAQERLN